MVATEREGTHFRGSENKMKEKLREKDSINLAVRKN